MPPGTAPGSYRFYYYLDARGDLFESNENNNAYYWPITVTGSGEPDLTRSTFTLDNASIVQGDRLRLDLVVHNTGSVPTERSSKVAYYFAKGGISYAPSDRVDEATSQSLALAVRNRSNFLFLFLSSLNREHIIYLMRLMPIRRLGRAMRAITHLLISLLLRREAES